MPASSSSIVVSRSHREPPSLFRPLDSSHSSVVPRASDYWGKSCLPNIGDAACRLVLMGHLRPTEAAQWLRQRRVSPQYASSGMLLLFVAAPLCGEPDTVVTMMRCSCIMLHADGWLQFGCPRNPLCHGPDKSSYWVQDAAGLPELRAETQWSITNQEVPSPTSSPPSSCPGSIGWQNVRK